MKIYAQNTPLFKTPWPRRGIRNGKSRLRLPQNNFGFSILKFLPSHNIMTYIYCSGNPSNIYVSLFCTTRHDMAKIYKYYYWCNTITIQQPRTINERMHQMNSYKRFQARGWLDNQWYTLFINSGLPNSWRRFLEPNLVPASGVNSTSLLRTIDGQWHQKLLNSPRLKHN